MADPAVTVKAERDAAPTHAFPDEAWTPEELARMNDVAAIDPDVAVAWMLGEGPDPWPEQSR